MITIENIEAFEVLDSRGNPTVKARVTLSDGTTKSSIVPSGASTGKREALELRDVSNNRYMKKGVLTAISHVNNEISNALRGLSPFNQALIDNKMKHLDKTENYSNLGANAVLGVSMSVARASSKSLNIPLYRYLGGINGMLLPVGMFNIINGGSHANNIIDFQEYMIMPIGFKNFKDALQASAEIYHMLKKILKENNENCALGDEGGFAPNLSSNEEPIEVIMQAISQAGYIAGKQIAIALDVAASEFEKDGKYHLKAENRIVSSEELIDYYVQLCSKYPIISIEDGLSENDWSGWELLTKKLANKIQIVGDDIFVTNSAILAEGIKKNIANAILIKPNQIGTISQTMSTVRLAQQNGYNCIMSHRSGESEDTFIADFSVALNCIEIKTGATARGERTAKYNRLLEIENELIYAQYLGENFLA